MYLALGGPNVGKTSGGVMECIQNVCRQGKKRALLVSSLCKVRNLHVAMLRSALDESVFCEQVRVVGSSGLDELARNRTLQRSYGNAWRLWLQLMRIGSRSSMRQRRMWLR